MITQNPSSISAMVNLPPGKMDIKIEQVEDEFVILQIWS